MSEMRLEAIGAWLNEETGTEWDTQRVHREYLLPIADKIATGFTALDAKNLVCDALGIAPGRRSALMRHLETFTTGGSR